MEGSTSHSKDDNNAKQDKQHVFIYESQIKLETRFPFHGKLIIRSISTQSHRRKPKVRCFPGVVNEIENVPANGSESALVPSCCSRL